MLTDYAVAINLFLIKTHDYNVFIVLTFCRHNGDCLWLKVEVILVKLMIVSRHVVILKSFF